VVYKVEVGNEKGVDGEGRKTKKEWKKEGARELRKSEERVVERKKKWKKEYAEERKREERITWRNKEANARMIRKKKEKK
jgi:hypothetical protein